MSVFLPLSPALVIGFRRFPVAVVSPRRCRSGSLRLSSHPRGMKAWARPSVGTLEAAGGEGGQTVPGRMGDDAVVCCWPTMDLGPVACRPGAIRAVAPSVAGQSCRDAGLPAASVPRIPMVPVTRDSPPLPVSAGHRCPSLGSLAPPPPIVPARPCCHVGVSRRCLRRFFFQSIAITIRSLNSSAPAHSAATTGRVNASLSLNGAAVAPATV